MQTKRKLIDPKGKKVVVAYDEYGIVDTIEYEGKLVASTHHAAKRVLNNADDILAGMAPKGWKWQEN